jgi:excisionase family DNA binding protein
VTTTATDRGLIVDPRELPPCIDVPTAAVLLGISRTSAYRLVRDGVFPVPVLHLGRAVRIPTAPLLELVRVAG